MPAHALPRRVAVRVEASLADVESDWDTNGTEIYVIDPDVSGVTQAALVNENIQDSRLNPHEYILGLKSDTTFTCSMYVTAPGVSASEDAQAADTALAKILKASWGGHSLGYAAGIAGGTASAPELDADPPAAIIGGTYGFFYDTSGSTGVFRRVESIATATLTLLENLPFTPDNGGADVMHAVIVLYPNEDALNNHDDANHTTLGWKVQGTDTEDNYVVRGAKPSIGEISITAGEPVKIQATHKCVTYEDTPAATSFTDDPEGEAPNVPGVGTTTTARLGAFGGSMSSVDCYGSITFTPGIDHDKVMGPNGTGGEGVHGYVGTGLGESTLEIVVPYDNAYDTAWKNRTKYHFMVQVGDQPTNAWGLYCPRLEMKEKPQRVDEGGITSHRLLFRCLRDTAAITDLEGDEIELRRAPWVVLLAA